MILKSLSRVFVIGIGVSITYCAQAADKISNDTLTVTVEREQYTLQAVGQAQPFATGTVRGGKVSVASVADPHFGQGHTLRVTDAQGGQESFTLYPHLPFVLHQVTLSNPQAEALTLNKVPTLAATLTLPTPVEQLSVLGTGGLSPASKPVGSYAWVAVANPQTQAGVVGGWLTHERGSGVIFTKNATPTQVAVEARLEYGRLRIEPQQSVASETLALGWFADARLGLEAWADAVAKNLDVHLKPKPVVYCTWYDEVHRGAGSAESLAELATFAAKELKPYGFTCVQIDDGWQIGKKGNGPKKNFTAHNPTGPYPRGMKPTADQIRATGLTAGLWLLPFGGTWDDPDNANRQDWFVKRADGQPFDTPWGGTCLDLTNPGARAFVAGEIKQAVHDWGYHYLKLDGLSTGCGVKPQYINDSWKEDNLGDGVFLDKSRSNIDVFRGGLRMVREAAGPDTFILGCCAPQNMRSYAGSFGLVNAMRIGPDNGGSWEAWVRKSPAYGGRNYHLNGRIWWNDPDPIYLRAKIATESVQAMAAWNSLAGQMISLSDWLPQLSRERLDILRRCLPSTTATARPDDLFAERVPRVWLTSDTRPNHQRRDVLGLYNWKPEPSQMVVALAKVGLPVADEYAVFDFWKNELVPAAQQSLTVTVAGNACRILAVRPWLSRPFLLSTSRHVSQGIIDVLAENWNAEQQTLAGRSAVVGGDPTELRIVPGAAKQAWSLTAAEVSAEDRAAGVTLTTKTEANLIRVTIQSPAGREVHWSVRLAPPAAPANERK